MSHALFVVSTLSTVIVSALAPAGARLRYSGSLTKGPARNLRPGAMRAPQAIYKGLVACDSGLLTRNSDLNPPAGVPLNASPPPLVSGLAHCSLLFVRLCHRQPLYKLELDTLHVCPLRPLFIFFFFSRKLLPAFCLLLFFTSLLVFLFLLLLFATSSQNRTPLSCFSYDTLSLKQLHIQSRCYSSPPSRIYLVHYNPTIPWEYHASALTKHHLICFALTSPPSLSTKSRAQS